MAYPIKYDARFNGAKAVSRGGQISTSYNNDGSIIYDVPDGQSVTCTGYYYDGIGSYIYPQTTDGMWLIVNIDSADWAFTEGTGKYSYSQPTAQRLVNKIIKNNAHILQNNLVCARFYNKLSSAQRKQLYDLQTRLEERNRSLLDDGILTELQTSQPKGYAELESALQKYMQDYQNGSIGLVISTTAVIVVSAVVVASLATAAYFAYKAFAAESDKDVRYSDDLTRTLMQKLTAEEYEQLMQETKGIVTKARLKAAVGGASTAVKLALVAVCGIALYQAYKSQKKYVTD